MYCIRIQQVKSEQLPVIDVDGSYMYRKEQSLLESGVVVAPQGAPSPPLSGWETVSNASVKSIAPKVPVVTSGISTYTKKLRSTCSKDLYLGLPNSSWLL